MKKNIIKAKRQRSKRGNITSLNVSTMQGDDKPNNDFSNEIHICSQKGMPEDTKKKNHKIRRQPLTGTDLLKKRISFADFRKQSRAHKYGRNSI